MASFTNYAQVLAQMARDKTLSSTKGFVSGAASAALSEMPAYSGITNILSTSSSIRVKAERLSEQNSKDAVTAQKQGNVIALDTNRELRAMNRSIIQQTRISENREKRDKHSQMFAEENAREQANYNDRLLRAIKNIGKGSIGGAGAAESSAGGGDGYLDNILQSLLGAGAGAAASRRRGGATPVPGPGGGNARRGGGGGGSRPPRTRDAKGRFAKAPTGMMARFGAGRLAGLLGGFFSGPVGWTILGASLAPLLYEILDLDKIFGPVFDVVKNAFNRPPVIPGSTRRSTSLSSGQPPTGAGSEQSDTGAQLPPSTPENDSGIKWRVPLAKGNYRITSHFGEDRATGAHRGIDLAVSKGSVVVAAADGKVVRSGFDTAGGNFIVISHGNGYESKYMHLSTIGVAKGQSVGIGRYIGLSGNTGRSTGPHLHFEIWKGSNAIDPASLIPELKGKKTSSDSTTSRDKVPMEEIGGRSKSRSLQSSVSNITPSDPSIPSSVSAIASESTRFSYAGEEKPVVVRLVEDQAKYLGTSARASVETKQILSRSLGGRSARPSRKVDTRTEEEKLIDDAERRFIKGLERGFTTVYGKEITKGLKNLFPEMGKGVTESTVKTNRLFLGQTVSEGFGVPKAISKALDKAIGKDYSNIFTPIIADLTTTYLEVGSRKLGEAIFSGIGGMNAEQSRTLTGQILGNLKAGNKQTAFSQLLTGVSGGRLAYGPEAIFAKYGFKTPEEGINFIAEGLGKETAGLFDRTFFKDDTTAQQVLKEQEIEALKASGVAGSTKDTASNTESTTENVEKGNKQSGQYYTADAKKADTQIAQQQEALRLQKAQIEATQRAGRQVAAGGAPPTGGRLSNLLYDLAGSAITQKIVGGINNPYAQILAGSVISPFVTGGIKATGATLMSGFSGQGFNFATELGKELGGAAAGVFGEKAGSYVSSFFGPPAGSAEAAMAADGNFLRAGSDGASSSFGGTVMKNLPYIYAGYQALTGDVKGAAVTAGSYAAGQIGSAALAAQGISATPIFGVDPVSIAISLLVSFALSSLFKKKAPRPRLVYAIPVTGNNNINAYQKVFVQHEHAFPKEWNDYAISLLKVAFNAHKLIEARENKAGPYNFIAIAMNNNDIFLVLSQEITAQDKERDYFDKRNGKSSNGNWYYYFALSASAGQVASEIVDRIGQTWKEGAGDSDAIRRSIEQLKSKSFKSLSAGLISDLTRGDFALDPSVERGLFGLDPATAQAYESAINATLEGPPMVDDDNSGPVAKFRSPVFDLRTNEFVENPIFTDKENLSYGDDTSPVIERTYDSSVVAIGPDGTVIRALQGETLQQAITRVYGANTLGVAATGPALKPTAITPASTTLTGEGGLAGGLTVFNQNTDQSSTNNNNNNIPPDPSDVFTSMTGQTGISILGGG
jgi:hypothetical protein